LPAPDRRRRLSILFYGDALTSAAYGVIVLLAVPETRPATIKTEVARWPTRRFSTASS